MAERAGPLASLAALLRRAAPPSLHQLQAWFSQGEEYRDFVTLVRQCLPQHEAEVLAETGVGSQLAAFARRFTERYFPLPDAFEEGWIDEYSDLTSQIPIIRLGISYDDYHMMPEGWLPGYQLMAVLGEDPYEELGSDGARTALLESCAQHVPKELLERTSQGFSREVLHARLEGTRFDGATLMADWLCSDTGNAFMDYTDETPIDAPWDTETIRVVTEQWAQATDIRDRIHSLAEWLMVDPSARFRELLNFIEGREPALTPSMTLEEWAVRQREETG